MKEDRRNKIRIDMAVPVMVQGTGSGERRYRFRTVARNIGAGGLSAFSPRLLHTGDRIACRIRFARPGSNPPQAPEILTSGVVTRVEEQPGGTCRFAASFLLRLA